MCGLGGALCRQALRGAGRGGQHLGLQHPVAVPGAHSPSSLGLPRPPSRSGRLLRGALPALRSAVAPLQPLRAGGRVGSAGAALAGAALATRGNGHRIDEFTRSLAVARWAGAAASGPFRGRDRAPGARSAAPSGAVPERDGSSAARWPEPAEGGCPQPPRRCSLGLSQPAISAEIPSLRRGYPSLQKNQGVTPSVALGDGQVGKFKSRSNSTRSGY